MDINLREIFSDDDLQFEEQDILYVMNNLGYKMANQQRPSLNSYLLNVGNHFKATINKGNIRLDSDIKYVMKKEKFEEYDIIKPKAA